MRIEEPPDDACPNKKFFPFATEPTSAHLVRMEKIQTRNRAKLNVSIDSALKEEMVNLAATDGRSISWLIESALREYLKKIGVKVPPRGHGVTRLTGSTHARPRKTAYPPQD